MLFVLVEPPVPALIKLGCYNDDVKDPRPLATYLDNFRSLINWYVDLGVAIYETPLRIENEIKSKMRFPSVFRSLVLNQEI